MASAMWGSRLISPAVGGNTRRRQSGGVHPNSYFARALLKYEGQGKWEVVARVAPELADGAEQLAILANRSFAPHGYNLKSGGDRVVYSDEARKNMADARRGRKFPALSASLKGKKRPAIAAKARGRKATAATKAKISASMMGNKNRRKKGAKNG